MRLRWLALKDRFQASLFVQPMLFVLGAVLLGFLSIRVDSKLERTFGELPLGASSTVESARAVLSTVAGATITVAGIAFSIALLVIQLASSQYSPRVVHGLFRDPFNKRVMGVVVGTFTYCLVVLRSVRSALDQGGDAVVPNVSVGVAVVFGIASVLAIVAFINHNAHAMDVGEILERVTVQTIERLHDTWPESRSDDDGHHANRADPASTVHLSVEPIVVRSTRHGWVQYIDHRALLDLLPAGATARLDIGVGTFVTLRAPLCSVWSVTAPDAQFEAKVRACTHIGRTRTVAQDPAYGVRQLVDVALRALSPGVNDPTTAQDAIVHVSAVLAEAYSRVPPPSRHHGDHGRTVATSPWSHASLTAVAFGEIRLAAAAHPRVAVVVLDSIGSLLATLPATTPRACAAELHEQARLLVESCELADWLPTDLERVTSNYEQRVRRPTPSAAP